MDASGMAIAISEAKRGLSEGGIPIGAALIARGQVLGSGHNQRVQKGSVTLHGEMAALENAGRLEAAVYAAATMYTTLSPCDMCSGAILLYGIPKVVVGENSTFTGAEDHLRSRGVEVVVMNSQECVEIMTSFIDAYPRLWDEDIGEG